MTESVGNVFEEQSPQAPQFLHFTMRKYTLRAICQHHYFNKDIFIELVR